MRYLFAAATMGAALIAAPAFAQSMPGSSPAGGEAGPSIQPRLPAPDIAPPALPGAGTAPALATAPQVKHASSGDPTTELFDAINKNDYNAAQDALSRGADLTAENPLGETPLELAIDLNHNSITFMILAARNEGGTDSGPLVTGPPARPPSSGASPGAHHVHAMPAKLETPPAENPPESGSGTGTPNPSAGFNGFNGE